MSDGSSVLHTTVLRSEHSIYKQSNIIQESIHKLKEKDNESIFFFYFKIFKSISQPEMFPNTSRSFRWRTYLFIFFSHLTNFLQTKITFLFLLLTLLKKRNTRLNFFLTCIDLLRKVWQGKERTIGFQGNEYEISVTRSLMTCDILRVT